MSDLVIYTRQKHNLLSLLEIDLLGSLICNFIESINARKLREVCKDLLKYAQTCRWSGNIGLILNIDNWNRCFPNALRCDLSMHHPRITEKNLTCFQNLTYLDISNVHDFPCKLLEYFGRRLEYLNAQDCASITDKTLIYLQNLKEGDFSRCSKITDIGLSKLPYLDTLILQNCKQLGPITAFVFRSNLVKLSLAWCYDLTDEHLRCLGNLVVLDISYISKITDNGIVHLKNLEILYAHRSNGITYIGLNKLNKFRKLYADDGYFGPHIDDAKFIIDTYG